MGSVAQSFEAMFCNESVTESEFMMLMLHHTNNGLVMFTAGLDLLLSLSSDTGVPYEHRLNTAYIADEMSNRMVNDNAHLIGADGVWVIPTIPSPALAVQFNYSCAWSG